MRIASNWVSSALGRSALLAAGLVVTAVATGHSAEITTGPELILAQTTTSDSVVAPPPPAPPAAASQSSVPPRDPGFFAKGRRRVSITGGWASSFDDDYLLLGIGVGYFVANGLQVGVDFDAWLMGSPTIYKLSPRADYVLWQMPRLHPYAGGFYRWNFVADNQDDLSSYGGRAGAFYQGTRGGMAGAGVVYEHYVDCKYGDCDEVYPEVFFAAFF